jgi:threonine dehydratase
MLSLTDIERASVNLKFYIYPTPLLRCTWLEEKAEVAVLGKLENLQRTGSFKIRGAMNALLNLEPAARANGIVTASAGNHGLGVAQAARLLHCPATVFVPTTASALKVNKLRQFDLTLIQEGQDYDESEVIAQNHAAEKNFRFIHAFDQPEVIAGQGTIGLELLDQFSPPNQPLCVVVPIGGGGLISGIAIVLKAKSPKSKIIGVQSEASPAMVRALEARKVVDTPIEETVADGLAGRLVGENTLRLVQEYCDEVVLVKESSILFAMKEFYFRQGWRLEGSAAAGAAAILENKVPAGGMPIVLIISGGNIAEEQFYYAVNF